MFFYLDQTIRRSDHTSLYFFPHSQGPGCVRVDVFPIDAFTELCDVPTDVRVSVFTERGWHTVVKWATWGGLPSQPPTFSEMALSFARLAARAAFKMPSSETIHFLPTRDCAVNEEMEQEVCTLLDDLLDDSHLDDLPDDSQ